MTKPTTIKTWTHPASGETRVYVNTDALGYGDKLFLLPDDFMGYRPVLQTRNPRGYANRGFGKTGLDIGYAIAEKALSEIGLPRNVKFDQIVAAA